MKNLTSLAIRSAGVAVLLTGATLAAPAFAQDPAVVQTATDSCIRNAQQNGFALKEVVEAGASDRPGKDAKVVLMVTKDGADARQTCYYSVADGGVTFDDAVGAARNFPWWWLLLPIVGFPLLLAAFRGRDTVTRTVAEDPRYVGAREVRPEGIVRAANQSVNVHSGPDGSYRVTSTLYDGQRVALTGRRENNWVELAEGGWVQSQYIDAAFTGYANR
ncbi:SH3 domain-containing protein [Thermoleptolyngbya sichuanensis A183]|uniref:SH3 domain-containing protein n=1 Tax=Thermoleptolyngbya sichuanensis A183 TaxID=2737172 RepID=A0A6M8BFF8_9CYAN|nr:MULTISPECIES: SH3 domain-containing protein [Thermoleptolyngbya]MDG2615766.1 SH3 domain-containing protein [Thermoleptolyngbya sichuanensis XZ-Cy5]QKD81893.1 SH3 domain-containing protein [Thermoleptolyngbya sichuanensis A183]